MDPGMNDLRGKNAPDAMALSLPWSSCLLPSEPQTPLATAKADSCQPAFS